MKFFGIMIVIISFLIAGCGGEEALPQVKSSVEEINNSEEVSEKEKEKDKEIEVEMEMDEFIVPVEDGEMIKDSDGEIYNYFHGLYDGEDKIVGASVKDNNIFFFIDELKMRPDISFRFHNLDSNYTDSGSVELTKLTDVFGEIMVPGPMGYRLIDEQVNSDLYLEGDSLISVASYFVMGDARDENGSIDEGTEFVAISRETLSTEMEDNESELIYKFITKKPQHVDYSVVDSTLGKVLLTKNNDTAPIVSALNTEQEIPENYQSLNDNFDIAKMHRIEFIDFINGKYYADVEGMLEQIDITTGEPLYDGSSDKQLMLGLGESSMFAHKENGSFYVTNLGITESNFYLIDSNMDIIASASSDLKISPNRIIGTDATNGKFYTIDFAEYQRQNVGYLSTITYGKR